jgi:hypothetical protein
MELSGRHASAALPLGKNIGTRRRGCWVGAIFILDILEEMLLPLTGFEPRIFQPVPSHYSERATSAFP